jgi:hypothetical protein
MLWRPAAWIIQFQEASDGQAVCAVEEEMMDEKTKAGMGSPRTARSAWAIYIFFALVSASAGLLLGLALWSVVK